MLWVSALSSGMVGILSAPLVGIPRWMAGLGFVVAVAGMIGARRAALRSIAESLEGS